MLSFKHTKFACYIGFVVQAIINNFLPILFIIFQTNYNLSYEQLGRIVFINFFTQLLADALTPALVKRIGYKGAAITCHALAATGLCMLSVLPQLFDNFYLCIIISVIVYATGSGIIEVCLSPMVELLPSNNKAAAMAFLHSFYCWGQALTALLTTFLVFAFGFDNWQYIPLVWAIIPAVNLILFTRVPVVEQGNDEKQETVLSLFLTRQFWCFAIFMVCAGASEIAMAQWASVFAQNALGVNKFVGDLLGPCAFAIFMGSGRIIFGMNSGRFSPRKALIINNILCFICYVAVALCNIPILSLIACALCGFTVSLSWPGTYSLAAKHFTHGGTLMFSIFALCGDLGCSSGPWLLGFVADRVSLNAGFLVCAAFPVIMVLAAIFLLKEND